MRLRRFFFVADPQVVMASSSQQQADRNLDECSLYGCSSSVSSSHASTYACALLNFFLSIKTVAHWLGPMATLQVVLRA